MKDSEIFRIGGEFEIDPKTLETFNKDCVEENVYLYSHGCSALRGILDHLLLQGKKVIHLPYYICVSVVNTCMKAGFDVLFYELTDDFLFPFDYIDNINANDVLLTVNYFGFIDDNDVIRRIKSVRSDITFISDHVQSYWTYKNSEADYSFTSLRKHFAIPGGALVYCKHTTIKANQNIEEAQFFKNKLIGSFLKHLQLPDSVYLDFFEEGEKELDEENKILKAPALVQHLYNNIPFDSVSHRRKQNHRMVYEFGNLYGLEFLFSFKEGTIPLNIPIIIKNRDVVRKRLMAKNIFLPVHWPIQEFNILSKVANRMSANELSLVIDQRYQSSTIEYQLESLLKAIKYG